MFYAIFSFDYKTPHPSSFTLLPVLGTMAVITFANNGSLVSKVLGWKVFAGIGLISYSAYLWHQPLFAFAKIYSLNQLSVFTKVCLIIATFIFAIVSYKYVEIPFRNKARINTKQFSIFIISMFLLFVLCLHNSQRQDCSLYQSLLLNHY